VCDIIIVVVTIWKTGTILLLLTQQLLPKTGSRRNALVSLEKNEWPTTSPSSPDLNPMDYHVWGAMLGLNTEKAADIHHWNVWTVNEKVVQSLIRYYWIFTWKSELYSLNCCIYWTTCVILIKIAGYMAWILMCKRCKFGEKNLLQFQRYRIFPKGLAYFFGAP